MRQLELLPRDGTVIQKLYNARTVYNFDKKLIALFALSLPLSLQSVSPHIPI